MSIVIIVCVYIFCVCHFVSSRKSKSDGKELIQAIMVAMNDDFCIIL